jgi:hypothetical protein
MNNAFKPDPLKPPEPDGAAGEFQVILAAIAAAKLPATALAVEALSEVRRGIMTGEGPTTQGRAHFSRTLDAEDAALIAQILCAAGGEAGKPVTRAEAEILLDIHEMAVERADDGRFDELFVKAISHHVLSVAGRAVPPRQSALASSTPLQSWASPADFETVDREIAAWLTARLNRRRLSPTLHPLATALIGAGAVPFAMSIAHVLDWAM